MLPSVANTSQLCRQVSRAVLLSKSRHVYLLQHDSDEYIAAVKAMDPQLIQGLGSAYSLEALKPFIPKYRGMQHPPPRTGSPDCDLPWSAPFLANYTGGSGRRLKLTMCNWCGRSRSLMKQLFNCEIMGGQHVSRKKEQHSVNTICSCNCSCGEHVCGHWVPWILTAVTHYITWQVSCCCGWGLSNIVCCGLFQVPSTRPRGGRPLQVSSLSGGHPPQAAEI